jgi:hypothetical protein
MGSKISVQIASAVLGKSSDVGISAQELIERKSHQLLFVVVSRIAPAKGDLPFDKRNQAMIGYGYAMGVTTQILDRLV